MLLTRETFSANICGKSELAAGRLRSAFLSVVVDSTRGGEGVGVSTSYVARPTLSLKAFDSLLDSIFQNRFGRRHQHVKLKAG